MYNEKKINIKTGSSYKVPGIFAYEDTAKVTDVVLLIHGISTDKNEYLNFYETLARLYAQNKVATLRIDFRGHGDSKLSADHFTIASQLIDVISAINWLRTEGFSQINLLGTSFGAPPCIFMKSIYKDIIGKVYLIAPVLNYSRVFIAPESPWGLELFDNMFSRTIVQNQRIHITERFYVTRELVAEMLMIDVEAEVRKSNNHFVVIHGNKDSIVSFQISRDIASRNSNVQLFEFNNMDHGFTDCEDDEGLSVETANNIKEIFKIIENLTDGTR